MTNADRIRAMSDEQLAYFLACIEAEDEDEIIIDGQQFFDETEIKEWLADEYE